MQLVDVAAALADAAHNVERFELDKKSLARANHRERLAYRRRRAPAPLTKASPLSSSRTTAAASSIPSIPQFGRSPKSSPPSTAAQKF